MARIKWSAIGITNASGKSGGSVFSHNRAGAYVRRWAKPVNKQSDRQTEMRSLWGNVSQQWGRLSDEEVNLWKSAAQNTTVTDGFGDTRSMTGFSLFMRTNQNRTHGMGLPITQIPLPLETLPSIDILSVGPTLDGSAESASAIDIKMENGTPETTFTASVGFSVVSPNRNLDFGSVKNQFNFRLRKQYTTDAEGNANVKISNQEIADIIGAPFDASTLFVQVHNHSDAGQKSNPVTARGRIANPEPVVFLLSNVPQGGVAQGGTIEMKMSVNGVELPDASAFDFVDTADFTFVSNTGETKNIAVDANTVPGFYNLDFIYNGKTYTATNIQVKSS